LALMWKYMKHTTIQWHHPQLVLCLSDQLVLRERSMTYIAFALGSK